jgi:hypothetical protein
MGRYLTAFLLSSMPFISNKKALAKQIDTVIRHLAMEQVTVSYGSDKHVRLQKQINVLLEILFGLETHRYLTAHSPRQWTPEQVKTRIAMQEMLFSLPDDMFRQAVRVNRGTFQHIVRLIEKDSIFQNNSYVSQRPVWLQLMVALERFGCDGNGASVGQIARHAGIGAGSPFCFYT